MKHQPSKHKGGTSEIASVFECSANSTKLKDIFNKQWDTIAKDI